MGQKDDFIEEVLEELGPVPPFEPSVYCIMCQETSTFSIGGMN